MENIALLKIVQSQKDLKNDNFDAFHGEDEARSEYFLDVGWKIFKNEG